MRQEVTEWANDDVATEQLGMHEGRESPNIRAGRTGASESGIQLLLLSARRGLKRKGELEVFNCDSPEADPLLELESFSWNKALGLRLRSTKSGKLLMTLVPIQRPTGSLPVDLPQECRLPGIDSEQLENTWELCRVYADGRVVASLRCSPQPNCPPRSCWHDLGHPLRLRRRPCRQSFRLWVAAAGAVEAACSRCASFKTDDSSGHELTWALSRGLGVSVTLRASEDAPRNVREELGSRKESGVRKDVAEYWEEVASARKRWETGQANENRETGGDGEAVRAADGGASSTETDKETEVKGVVERDQDTLPSRTEHTRERNGVDSRVSDAEPSGRGLGESMGIESKNGGTGPSGRDPEVSGAVARADAWGHVPQRSLESVDEFFECESRRYSESGSEASVRDMDVGAGRPSSKSLSGIGGQGWTARPESANGRQPHSTGASHDCSRSVECFRGGVFREEGQSGSSKTCQTDAHQADATCRRGDEVAEPPLRRLGILESFLSSSMGSRQESGMNDLERPLLPYRSSGLQYDPASDIRALHPQGSLVPSGFNTSAMVPLSAELAQAPVGKTEIVFSDVSGGARSGESVIASARSSGFACRKRLNLRVSATCPADTLALTMLAHYLWEVVDVGS